VGNSTVTNDFKDMPRGTQYTVRVKVSFYKNNVVNSSVTHTDRTITP
jgi:hypothetical protein